MSEHTDNCRISYWLSLQINGDREFLSARDYMLGYKRDKDDISKIIPPTPNQGKIKKESAKKGKGKKRVNDISFITEAP